MNSRISLNAKDWRWRGASAWTFRGWYLKRSWK
jgi:hypothetical protein